MFSTLAEHGRIPPQAVDLEEAVLGACMLEDHAYDQIGHILSPECFYKESHQITYKAIEMLRAEAKPVDILTVTNQLKTTGELELVGGAYWITQLTNRVASTANLEFHSMIVFQKYSQREMIRVSSEIIKASFEDTGFDEAERAYRYGTEIIDALLAGRKADRNMLQVMKDHEQEVGKRIKLKADGQMTGIQTGIIALNKYTNGWKPGELVIIAGRPGMGKTAVALNLFSKHAAGTGKKILFFSFEMDDLSLADRMVCSYGGIDADNLKSGRLEKDEISKYYDSKAKIERLPMWIDDSTRVDTKHITTISRAKRRKNECDMIVIDYLQLIESPQVGNYYNKNREREVAEISRSMKMLARELKVPVILLAQLNRAVEARADKKPSLGDLRESGAIEQDADLVIFPYRPEYYHINEDDTGKSLEGVMVLVIAKNRNGRTGEVLAKYSPDMTQFFDYDYNDESEKAPY